MTDPDIEQIQVMAIKICRHGCPIHRRRNGLGHMFANTAHAQHWNGCRNGCHKSSLSVGTVSKLARRSN